MNRPRNRQPRPPRKGQRHDNRSGFSSHGSPATPQQAAGTVPTIQQIVPGASVFIVLKEDQPTGKETAGIVAELLTRGNHPRGIKVRLQDGLVGRVQRMARQPSAQSENMGISKSSHSTGFAHRYTDVRNDLDHPSEPPARSLADFLPTFHSDSDGDGDSAAVNSATATDIAVRCPFCCSFKGDEAAVTYHIERKHLT